MNDHVDFVCGRTDHQGAEPNDALTMHEDRWAYCAAGADAPHDWRATGGMSLDDAKQFARRQQVRPLDTTVHRSD